MKHQAKIIPLLDERRQERQAAQKWRLKRTLKRRTEFRPIEDDDCRYAWVAYKKGILKTMGPHFSDGSMGPEEFKKAFVVEVSTNYAGGWTLSAQTEKGFMPVGIVLGFYSHPNPALAPFMIIGDMIWFPWASARNKIESAVAFFNAIRKQMPIVEYADENAKPFFEMIAQHGIMRRVGTTFSVYPGRSVAIFETRAP